MNRVLAIANCRVSTADQLENNSLNTQHLSVIKAAKELNVTIPDDGWWSGYVSSKRDTNVFRKDLRAMLERCRRDKRIKYVIVNEPDRFMRSVDEANYFEVSFRMLGVTVWYASDPELNTGDMTAKMLKFIKYFNAEGSNEERQRKSITGQSQALLDGRWTFNPKPGYKRGYTRGIPEVHPTYGPIVRDVLLSVVNLELSPTEALKQFNLSVFVGSRPHYKMDKFRKILTDPFYAGILVMDKQIKIRNENGKHSPLITKNQHEMLVAIMENKKKNQLGPRKNGNPKYPLSNIVSCDNCTSATNGRLVGFDHGNGVSKHLLYEKYRCRACKRYTTRDSLHEDVRQLLDQYRLSDRAISEIRKALCKVWDKRRESDLQTVKNANIKIRDLESQITSQVDSAIDPSNCDIKNEILASISKKRTEVMELKYTVEKINKQGESDLGAFIEFSLNFCNDLGTKFFDISRYDRLLLKELLLPGGFRLSPKGKVYTTDISVLYRLKTNKKGTEVPEMSTMVRVKRL